MTSNTDIKAEHVTLLVRPHPIRNEGPKGYMLRLAEANWMTHKELQSIGLIYEYQILQYEALMPLKEVDPVLHQQVELYSGLMHQKRSVWNHRYARFCPHCLADDIFWRVEWELLFYDACSIHGTWLIDKCGSCGSQLSWDRGMLVRCQCGADLRAEESNACPTSVTLLSEVLKNKINHLDPEEPYPVLFSTTDAEQTQRIIRYLGTYMNESSGKNPLKVHQAGTMSRSWPITTYAAEIITHWPEAFQVSFAKMQHKGDVKDKPTLGATFGAAYHYLYKGLTGPAFNEIRTAFELWLSESWKGGLAKRNKRLTSLVLDKATWIPGNLACDTLGISIRRLKYLINEGAIEGECYISETDREFVMVHRESIELIKHNLTGEIDMTTTATLLGLGKKRIRKLLRLIFPVARKTGTFAAAPWTVSRFEVNKLLDIAEDIPKVCIPDEGCVSLNHILRYWAWTTEDIVNLVYAVRTSELMPVNVLDGVAGISGWIFLEYVLKAWREKSVQGLGIWLTITQTAKLIGINQEAAYHLANMHLLKSELMHGQPHGGKRIRRTEVENFAKTYIFATEVAQRLGVSPNMAISILKKSLITPISGPSVDKGRQVLFLRTEALERIFIEVKNEEQLPMELH
ncbi:MAG: TniQ family protein [Methylotenera sp.]|nr:TniQ family protein [Methylotenera sp.]